MTAAVLMSRLRDAVALLRVRIIHGWNRVNPAIVGGLGLWDDVKQAAVRLMSRLRDAVALLRLRIIHSWNRVNPAIVGGPGFWVDVKQAAGRLRLWDGLKKAWLRILTSLFMTVVLVAGCHWMWGVWHSWQLANTASVTTTWPTNTLLGNVAVEVKTKCSDAVLFYVVSIIPPKSDAALTLAEKTDMAKVTTDRLRERLNAIALQLVDKDGFQTAAFTVRSDDFVRNYSTDDERPVSLVAMGTLACTPASYLRAEELMLNWTERP